MSDDQNERALSIARLKLSAGDAVAALRFVKKAGDSPEATKLQKEIEAVLASPSNSSFSARTTATEPSATASTTHARPKPAAGATSSSASSSRPATGASTPKAEDKKREYTEEQISVVRRVRGCKSNEFYEVLSLTKTCSDGEIKKAYRKLALALHPDKNGAPGADEAFKLVSKAFQILSDPDKRAVFDRDGADPDSRGGGGGMPNFSGMRHRGGAGGFNGGFQGQEINPEDLFNAFFGGGGFGNAQTFSFGNGGFHSTRVYPQQRARQQQQRDPNAPPPPLYVQLMPLLVLILFGLLNFLPSLLSAGQTPPPAYDFTSTSPRFNERRMTSEHGVDYWVAKEEWTHHPMWEAVKAEQRGEGRGGIYKLKKFERDVEMKYVSSLQSSCIDETERRNQHIERSRGFFGFGSDWDEVRRLQREPLPSCEKLRAFREKLAN